MKRDDVWSGVVRDVAAALMERVSRGDLPERLIARDDGAPYLRRYYLGGRDSERFGVFLHRFESSDSTQELHAHPWLWSHSVILSGVYLEERMTMPHGARLSNLAVWGHIPDRWDWFKELAPVVKRIYRPGDVNIIEASDIHRIELVDGPVWTLFVHGPRTQEWGFVDRETGAYRGVAGRTFDQVSPPPAERISP